MRLTEDKKTQKKEKISVLVGIALVTNYTK